MKRKPILMLLVLALALCAGIALAEQEGSLENLITVRSVDPVDDLLGLQEGEVLTVGSPTEMAGYFATDLWGNNTADIDVRNLLHGYSTIAWLRSSELMFNGASVAAAQVSVDAAGNRTYIVHLMTDMQYNDGTPITAKDYLFSLLLCASPQIAELGGQPRGLSHFVGYEAYQNGEATGISGIRLLSDYSFSLTVAGEYLPYFYGLALLEITPYPMHVIAPGCDILDDGDGAYIGQGAEAATMSAAELGFEPGVFSAAMLSHTLLDPETGYVFNPKVTSGPYSLESYDKAAKTASFVVNESYYGNYEGQKPHIERIVFKHVANEDMYEALESGEVQLINKALDGETVMELQQLTGTAESEAMSASYARTGLAYLALACEDGVTADVAVRQAIARCVDKDMLIGDLSQYALAVHGYYGLGQWIMTYSAPEDEEKGLAAIDVTEEIELLKVAYDLEAAKALLEAAGWAYSATGEAYTEGVRYRKEDDGSLTPLVIRWAKTSDSSQTDTIEAHLSPAFEAVGIGLEVTEMTFTEMLPHFYRTKERAYDMFFLGSNFLDVFDPYYDYNTAEAYQGTVNTSGLQDEELMALAWEMRTTPASEMQAYALKWLAFQQRWVELMPLIPLYSNVYFDVYTDQLQDYDVTQSTSWALSIPYAWIGEPIEAEDLVLMDADGGDDGIFIAD